jgi:hypothetical protein
MARLQDGAGLQGPGVTPLGENRIRSLLTTSKRRGRIPFAEDPRAFHAGNDERRYVNLQTADLQKVHLQFSVFAAEGR